MLDRFLNGNMEDSDYKRLKLIGISIGIVIILLIVGNIFINRTPEETITIKLIGDEIITVKQYEQYNELGATATSSASGDISQDIITDGVINTSVVGEYHITYTITGTDNNEYTVTRTVNVIPNENNNSNIATHTISNSIYTADALDINLTIELENYKYTVLPNNQKNYGRNITYTVSYNGSFTFYVYDKSNKYYEYKVNVGNIDNIVPTATCTAITENNKTTITIIASDSGSGVAGYSYSLTGDFTNYLTTNKYTVNGTGQLAYVKVKDNAGNVKSASCTIFNGGNTPIKPTFVFDNNKPILGCTTYTQTQWQELANQLVAIVDSSGRGTRAGVVAAARFLAGLPYRLPYMGAKKNQDIGQYYHLGLNSNPTNGWGCHGNGLDCSGFVTWTLLNGGIDKGKMWVGSDYGPRKRILDVANQIKVGDFVFQESRVEGENFSHIGIVIGVDANNIYVAEERGKAMLVTTVSKTVKHYVFTYVALSDLYPSEGNITNMW